MNKKEIDIQFENHTNRQPNENLIIKIDNNADNPTIFTDDTRRNGNSPLCILHDQDT